MDYTIDTIFYFVGTEAEYQRMRENISPKTIVFVQDSHEIYLNGWAYGKTSTNGLATTEEVGNLSDAVDAINGRIGEVSDTLDTMLTDLNGRIDDRVSDQIETADLLAKNAYLNGQIGTKIGEWSQQAHVVTEDSVTWSSIMGNVDSLTLSVNKVLGNFNADGSFKPTQTLQTIIDQRIDGNQSIAQIAASWALLDNNERVLQWLASGFDAQTIAGNNSFAAMYAAGKNAQSDAIAALRTEVNTTLNGYVATSELTSRVTNILNDKGLTTSAISGLATKDDVDDAEAAMFAKYEEVSDDLETVNDNLAAITATANSTSAQLNALSQTVTNQATAIAGLQTKTGLDTAVAELLASTTSESGKGANGAIGIAIANGISTATISANQINLEGLVTANNNFKIMSDGSMETIAGKIGGFTIEQNNISTEVRQNYDQSNYFLNSLELNSLQGPTLKLFHNAYAVSDDSLIQTAELCISPVGFYTRIGNGTHSNEINTTGSGFLANGYFSWDGAGNITVDASKLTLNNGLIITRHTVGESALATIKIDTWLCDTSISPSGISVTDGNVESGFSSSGMYVRTHSGNSYTGTWVSPGEIRTNGDIKVEGDIYIGDPDHPEYKLDVSAAVTAGILTPVTNNA